MNAISVRPDGIKVFHAKARPTTDEWHIGTQADRSASVDAPGELLRTIAEVLNIRDVFPRVSAIANQILPHDCLEVVVYDRADHTTLQARSSDRLSEYSQCILLGTSKGDIVRDLPKTQPTLGGRTSRAPAEPVGTASIGSLLSVQTVAGRQVMRLGFLSAHPVAYTYDDVPSARRIADHIAVVVAHERLAEVAAGRAEARVRGERFDNHVRMLTETDWKGRRGGVIGNSAAWRNVLAKATRVASQRQPPSFRANQALARKCWRA